ncbi:MAG: ABC-F family ATP-binding cassette domain-containing protein [Candidatus Omnitrophica bacterium]|nr:ABC-F family ATP-binding cassette domain-containing protein [Candidatus Omnitrophota bacterium]
MPVLLQINQIYKAYGANTILDDATASFETGQKIGVIGRNGAGKSTLCRIITGHEKADDGSITPNSELRLSYLEQHDTFGSNESVVDFLMRKTKREHWECGEMAAHFQIQNELLDIPVQKLPGGYQTRVKLTAMLLEDPNFLVLDEPSNYLDLSTLILLENFLLDFKGGYLVVSHDREFLKRTCDHTLELENGELTLYPGDIEEYFEFKEGLLVQKQAYNRGVEKKREQLQAFVDRFRAKASTASRAQSKLKQIQKLKTIEITHQAGSIRIYIPKIEPKTGIAFASKDLTIGYPEKDVASGISFEVERGERVAVLGNNGEGKTTFLRTIAGQLAPKAGSFRWGTGLKTAYYAQHVFSVLDPEDNIYSHLVRESASDVTSQDVLTMAGCFLFRGDDVKKKIKVLSGGERARLILAGLLLSKSHVLLLDEPTNHLDFETVEALAQALKKFAGTVFFISHDRTFVNLIATSIVEVKQGRIQRYPGTYEDYVYHLEVIARGEMEGAASLAHEHIHHEPKKHGSGQSKSENQSNAENKIKQSEIAEEKSNKSKVAKIKSDMEKEERRIKHLTGERDKLLEEIQKNTFHFSKERNARMKNLQIEIEKSEDKWCTLQAKLDFFKK